MTLEQEQIEMRNKITAEYIEYLRENERITQNNQTRMKNTGTTFGKYFTNEQQVIKTIEKKVTLGVKLTKVEENRLENYKKIINLKDSYEIDSRNKITEEYIEYLIKNNGIISVYDNTRMKNCDTFFQKYLINEKTTAVKKIERKIISGEQLTKVEQNRLENYNKIIVEKNKLMEEAEIKKCNDKTKDYIKFLIDHNFEISRDNKEYMQSGDITYGIYLHEEQKKVKKIEEKKSLGEHLTKVEENRLENYKKIINLKDDYAINTRNKITEEYMEYLKKNNGIISVYDDTRMENCNAFFRSYLIDEKAKNIKKIEEKIALRKKLTKVEENRLENYNKIVAEKNKLMEETELDSRNKITEEYIEYLRKNNGIILFADQKRMKNRDTTFGVYLQNEQRAIIAIEEKIAAGEKLTKIEENRLENYYNIIAIKEELTGKKTRKIDISTGNPEKDKIIKELKKKLYERRKNNKRPVWNYNIGEILKHFDVDIKLLNTYLSRVSSGTQKSNPIMYSENESLRNYCIRNGFNYSVIFRAIKLKQFCKNDTLEQLINRAVTNYQIKGQNTPDTWIYEKYGYVAKHILLRLGLSSEDIFRDMTSHVINLEEAMRHDYFKKNVLDKKHAWLEELLNYLMEQIDYTKEEEEIINQIANEIYSFEDIYKLTEEEFKILLNVLRGYIETLREYNICDVGLEENEKERARKIKDYNLDEYEIEESFLIPLEFEKGVLLGKKSSLYKRRELLRTYIIDWNQYTDKEKEQIVANEKFTKEEINMINSFRNKIDQEIEKTKGI